VISVTQLQPGSIEMTTTSPHPTAAKQLAALEERRVTVDTARGEVSCIDVGPRDGTAAVFVHGVGTNAHFWRHALDALAPEKRCIALDLPLHGHSPAPADDDFSIGAYAATVGAFVDSLDVGPVDLVAHDTGGALAQIVAARGPERLRTFTLTNCDTHDNVPPEAFLPTVELARSGLLAASAPALLADLDAARTAVFAMGYEDPAQPPIEVVRDFLEPVLGTPARAAAFERLIAGMAPDDLLAAEPALRKLDVPTLVVWGTADEFFEVRWAEWLRNTIPGVTEVVMLDGAKLFFPDERAAELVPHLRRHWASVDGQAV
jgi:pimeloyl-ACP methyl ester carboxylesterase